MRAFFPDQVLSKKPIPTAESLFIAAEQATQLETKIEFLIDASIKGHSGALKKLFGNYYNFLQNNRVLIARLKMRLTQYEIEIAPEIKQKLATLINGSEALFRHALLLLKTCTEDNTKLHSALYALIDAATLNHPQALTLLETYSEVITTTPELNEYLRQKFDARSQILSPKSDQILLSVMKNAANDYERALRATKVEEIAFYLILATAHNHPTAAARLLDYAYVIMSNPALLDSARHEFKNHDPRLFHANKEALEAVATKSEFHYKFARKLLKLNKFNAALYSLIDACLRNHPLALTELEKHVDKLDQHHLNYLKDLLSSTHSLRDTMRLKLENLLKTHELHINSQNQGVLGYIKNIFLSFT